MDRQTGKRILLGAAVLALALIAGLRGGSMVQAIAQSRSERTLVIDAGHGGFDGGATGSNGTAEQDINLSIAQRVQALAGFFGVRTAMTRADENALAYDPSRTIRENKVADIKAREQIVEEASNPVFLSIHLNQFGRSPIPRCAGILLAQPCRQQCACGILQGLWRKAVIRPNTQGGQAGGTHDLL